jgi:hypothetical protein
MNFRTRGAGGNISATPELTGFDTVLNIYRLVTLVPLFFQPRLLPVWMVTQGTRIYPALPIRKKPRTNAEPAKISVHELWTSQLMVYIYPRASIAAPFISYVLDQFGVVLVAFQFSLVWVCVCFRVVSSLHSTITSL